MATEQRLIDANKLKEQIIKEIHYYWNNENGGYYLAEDVIPDIEDAPTVDAVEVPDKELLRAIKLLIKQYEHSKNSEYVHSPVAHALYHTWKQVEEKR